ncbi:MAG: hypothetical protein U0R26_08610 [Solirubrobacterales bacterium]
MIDLVGAEREVIVLDMPGFGRAPPLPDELTEPPRTWRRRRASCGLEVGAARRRQLARRAGSGWKWSAPAGPRQ